MFEGIIGGIVWFLANVFYIDLKRKGRPGWSRMILFWIGNPLTWLWFFLIREGSAPPLVEAPDDADALLAEIRRERRLGVVASEDGKDAEDPKGSPKGYGPGRRNNEGPPSPEDGPQ